MTSLHHSFQPDFISDRDEEEDTLRECAYCGDNYPESEMVEDKKTGEWIHKRNIGKWVEYCKPYQTVRENKALEDKLLKQLNP